MVVGILVWFGEYWEFLVDCFCVCFGEDCVWCLVGWCVLFGEGEFVEGGVQGVCRWCGQYGGCQFVVVVGQGDQFDVDG